MQTTFVAVSWSCLVDEWIELTQTITDLMNMASGVAFINSHVCGDLLIAYLLKVRTVRITPSSFS
jgi:hypothetical protein